MKEFLRVLKWLVILALVSSAAFLVYASVKINQPLRTQDGQQSFTVLAGVSTTQVARDLTGAGLISRPLFFQLYLIWKKQDAKIQAGSYLLSPTMSIREIAEILTAGQVIDNKVVFTVIEGWTVQDIAEALENAGVVKQRAFLAAENPSPLSGQNWADEFSFLADNPPGYGLGGFLFPDTYYFAKNVEPEEVIRKMLANFGRKLTAELRAEITNQGQSIYKIVTLASIIEKEVGRNLKKGTKLSSADLERLRTERRLVAGVFYNRLKINKALESDATVGYVTGSKSNRATIEQTKIVSPYNTYLNIGLPPGPISNPSLDAILAAIYPAETPYLYFVTAPDGTAYFAKTLAEHIQNRALYLQ